MIDLQLGVELSQPYVEHIHTLRLFYTELQQLFHYQI